MYSDRESKILALFEAAQAVSVEKRAELLSKECGDGGTGSGLGPAVFGPDAKTVIRGGRLSSDWTKGTSLYEMPLFGGTPKRIWDAPGS